MRSESFRNVLNEGLLSERPHIIHGSVTKVIMEKVFEGGKCKSCAREGITLPKKTN